MEKTKIELLSKDQKNEVLFSIFSGMIVNRSLPWHYNTEHLPIKIRDKKGRYVLGVHDEKTAQIIIELAEDYALKEESSASSGNLFVNA